MDKLLIAENVLSRYLQGDSMADKSKALLLQQKENWELLRKGYESLETVQTKTFEFDGFYIKVQFNPGRIKSTAAKVDKVSINERPCFLCKENLPQGQRGIEYSDDYIILCNPYPIFPEHFTIPLIKHLPQNLINRLIPALYLTKELSEFYTVFYNGPKCGASAPDHMHFQAGNKYFMPIDSEYDRLKGSHLLPVFEYENLVCYHSKNYLRNFISLESGSEELLQKAFDYLIKLLPNEMELYGEPMINVLAYYEDNKWKVIIFPRTAHRPKQFFADEPDRILLSPAAVDLGGVFITPREEDFYKLTKDDIADIYQQVTLPEDRLVKLTGKLKNFKP